MGEAEMKIQKKKGNEEKCEKTSQCASTPAGQQREEKQNNDVKKQTRELRTNQPKLQSVKRTDGLQIFRSNTEKKLLSTAHEYSLTPIILRVPE